MNIEEYHGILAEMAYFPEYMVPGICVHPSGREPLLSVQEYL